MPVVIWTLHTSCIWARHALRIFSGFWDSKGNKPQHRKENKNASFIMKRTTELNFFANDTVFIHCFLIHVIFLLSSFNMILLLGNIKAGNMKCNATGTILGRRNNFLFWNEVKIWQDLLWVGELFQSKVKQENLSALKSLVPFADQHYGIRHVLPKRGAL